MKIFSKKQAEEKKAETPKAEERGFCNIALNYSQAGAKLSDPLTLSTVYRCVEVISDSVAQLPIEPYGIDEKGYRRKLTRHPSYNLLAKEPNPLMSRYTFIKQLVTSMLLYGNGYAYIKRDRSGNATSLLFLPAGYVTVIEHGLIDESPISYKVTGIVGEVPAEDIIHILNYSYDGIHGISTLAYAANAVQLANAGEAHARGFFTGGANVGGILTVQGPLNQNQANDIKAKWNSSFGPVGQPNGVAVLPGNMEFKQITVNPADAQLLESRQYSVIDICRFFGVSPVKCFDLTKSSYSTVEATQLAFLTDTLSPILEKIELEFERKLFRKDEKFKIDVKFDVSSVLRIDLASRSTYYREMFNVGALSPNEVRKELNMEPIEGGDDHFLQVNMQPLAKAEQDDTSTE